MEHFDIRVWVAVSKDIVHKVSDESFRFNEIVRRDEIRESELSVRVFQNLKHKRYVIVMDDVWGREVWDEVTWGRIQNFHLEEEFSSKSIKPPNKFPHNINIFYSKIVNQICKYL